MMMMIDDVGDIDCDLMRLLVQSADCQSVSVKSQKHHVQLPCRANLTKFVTNVQHL